MTLGHHDMTWVTLSVSIVVLVVAVFLWVDYWYK